MPAVLITGAARGLGLDFVKQYAAKGWKVHACARDPAAASLTAVKGDVQCHKLEVTDYKAMTALANKLSCSLVSGFSLEKSTMERASTGTTKAVIR